MKRARQCNIEREKKDGEIVQKCSKISLKREKVNQEQ